MAKNFYQDGEVLDLIAPAGGVKSGDPVRIGDINAVALVDAEEGEVFAGRVTGVFWLPAADGLEQGASVSLADGELAATAEGAAVYGKVVVATADGQAAVRLSN